ncbi:hypothetical protein JDV09_23485 [Mycobacterium sp. Y57]|nr:hypothetical protein [Mycolicibacterium xanthum]MBX7435036.1 hypothetical protein [Mycolicibacterium xanthum]
MAAAVLAAAGCVLSWLAAGSQVVVAPVLDGEPSTMSMQYSAPLLMLSLVLATVAGVLLVLAVSGLRRSRRAVAHAGRLPHANRGRLPLAGEHSS